MFTFAVFLQYVCPLCFYKCLCRSFLPFVSILGSFLPGVSIMGKGVKGKESNAGSFSTGGVFTVSTGEQEAGWIFFHQAAQNISLSTAISIFVPELLYDTHC